MRLRRLARLKARLTSNRQLRRVLKASKTIVVALRDVAIVVLAVVAILIAWRDYLKTDVRLSITSPAMGSVVLNEQISIEGTASGGPYNGFVVHHKAPGDDARCEVLRVQEDGEQMMQGVFPIRLPLTDNQGEPRIGRHTVTVTLKSGNRSVEQASVAFDVIDCFLVVPRKIAAGMPVHDPIDLRSAEEVPGYEFLYYIDGALWVLDHLEPMYLEDGYHELRIVAAIRGSEEEVDSVTTSVIVDNTPPIIKSLGLTDGAKVSSQTVLYASISDPHIEELKLCVDNDVVGQLSGDLLREELKDGEVAFTLESGWRGSATADTVAQTTEDASDNGDGQAQDGWHDVLISACDVNQLCTSGSVRVWVDNTPPELRWDLGLNRAIPVLPAARFWLGASTPDSEATIRYHAEPPALIAQHEFLDTDQSSPGTEHEVLVSAVDLAGNAEAQTAVFAVENSPRAWLNTVGRAVEHGISIATAPLAELCTRLAEEGLSIGVGTEVSASPSRGRKVLWRGIADCVFIEICPLIGRGLNENMTVGVAFRLPLGFLAPGGGAQVASLLQPAFEFGTALTPNWEVLDSLNPGTEQVTETWLKMAFETELPIPLPFMGGTVLGVSAGPGCKLTFVQELIRETEFSNDEPVGIRRHIENSVTLEVTMDISLSLSAGASR